MIYEQECTLELASNTDDIWFKSMELLNDVKCKKVNDDRDFLNRFLTVLDSQDITLMNSNLFEGDNDYHRNMLLFHVIGNLGK